MIIPALIGNYARIIAEGREPAEPDDLEGTPSTEPASSSRSRLAANADRDPLLNQQGWLRRT